MVRRAPDQLFLDMKYIYEQREIHTVTVHAGIGDRVEESLARASLKVIMEEYVQCPAQYQ